MHTVSRRGFLVLGGTGATGAVLASCGGSADDPREDGSDAELLDAAYAAETALDAAYESAMQTPELGESDTLGRFRQASARRADELRTLAEDAGGSPVEGEGDAGDPQQAADVAIAGYREGAGELSTTELRSTAATYLVECAAELAAIRGLVGEEPAPEPFVTGGAEPPFSSAEEPDDDAEDGEETEGDNETEGAEETTTTETTTGGSE